MFSLLFGFPITVARVLLPESTRYWDEDWPAPPWEPPRFPFPLPPVFPIPKSF
jgi:hypothetical protein